MKLSIFCCYLLLSVPWAVAEGTQTWEQSKFEEFEKGTARGIAIRSEGGLELAPQFRALYTSPSTFLWAITTDNAGNIYAAAGAPARVYRITPDGKSQVVFEPKELQVQALAERDGVLYAATSPDGKVYAVQLTSSSAEKKEQPETKNTKKNQKRSAGPAPETEKDPKPPSADSSTAHVFFDPQTKYIWDLAVDSNGQLYVATGDNGQIFRVSKSGEGSVFFKSDEAHIRALAFDHQGNLLAGSDGSGLIYRISPAGEAFVLYSASKKEITALAVDEDNNIYAAGIGEKRAPPIPAVPGAAPVVTQPGLTTGGATIAPANPSTTPANPTTLGGIPITSGGSEIYKIAADGAPTQLWNSRDELVYALAFERIAGKERLVAGTGNKGRIFAIRERGDYTDLVKASANQVTAIANGKNGALYLATSNLGKVFVLGPSVDTEGSYESDVFDAHLFSHWGRMQVRGQGNFELMARSGNVDNPDRNWSSWEKVNVNSAEGLAVQAPAARFVQWKAVLRAGQKPPAIESVTLNYRSKNAPPVIDDVAVQVGNRSSSGLRSSGEGATIIVGGDGGSPSSRPHNESFTSAPRKDSTTVRWSAHDDNNDELVYSLFYRGDGETQWKPLTKDKLTEKSYSFESDLLPDGGYTIKVVASDAPSHSPEDALTAEKESARFEVDTTPPRIEDLNAAFTPDNGGAIHVTFRANDSFSVIRRAEYSIDAGDWQFVEPVGKISDSRIENYDFNVPLPAGSTAGEHVVVVRAYDHFDNVGSAKAVVRK